MRYALPVSHNCCPTSSTTTSRAKRVRNIPTLQFRIILIRQKRKSFILSEENFDSFFSSSLLLQQQNLQIGGNTFCRTWSGLLHLQCCQVFKVRKGLINVFARSVFLSLFRGWHSTEWRSQFSPSCPRFKSRLGQDFFSHY